MKTKTKESPILFSGAMVRAILNGNKTMTRRVVKPNGESSLVRCPYGTVGDRLWVRETWRTCSVYDPCAPSQIDSGASVLWVADGSRRLNGLEDWGKVRTSIFMPRWASRITLEIVRVRVEPVQEITEEDAKSEGISAITKDGSLVKYGIPDSDGLPGSDDSGWNWKQWTPDVRDAFAKLWDSINAKRGCGWKMNPWVWVVEFKVVKKESEANL